EPQSGRRPKPSRQMSPRNALDGRRQQRASLGNWRNLRTRWPVRWSAAAAHAGARIPSHRSSRTNDRAPTTCLRKARAPSHSLADHISCIGDLVVDTSTTRQIALMTSEPSAHRTVEQEPASPTAQCSPHGGTTMTARSPYRLLAAGLLLALPATAWA